MKNKINWRNAGDLARRLVLLLVGLFFYGLGISITVKAQLGLSAWDVFHKGVSLHTPLTLGQAVQLTGFVIIAISFLLGIRPGLGTLANMYFIGFWIDLIGQANLIPDPQPLGGLVAQLGWVGLSLFALGLGSGLYLKAGLGAGPRDSFMLALVKRTGWRVTLCRTIIEISVCIIGALLGGPVGLATVVLAFGVGPAVELGLKVFHVRLERPTPQAVLNNEAA